MSNTPRALGGFPILALHPKSLRQIGNLWFFGTNSGIADDLFLEVRFWGEQEGDRSIGEANLRKELRPFYGSGTAVRPRSLSKMDSLAWLRCAGAWRACRRGGKPPGDWQSQCACPVLTIMPFIHFAGGNSQSRFNCPLLSRLGCRSDENAKARAAKLLLATNRCGI